MPSILANTRTVAKDLSMGKKWNFFLLFLCLSSLFKLATLMEMRDPHSFTSDSTSRHGISKEGRIEVGNKITDLSQRKASDSLGTCKNKDLQDTDNERERERERERKTNGLMPSYKESSKKPASLPSASRNLQAEIKSLTPRLAKKKKRLTYDYQKCVNEDKKFWHHLGVRFSAISEEQWQTKKRYITSYDCQKYIENVVWEHLCILFSFIPKDYLFVGLPPGSSSRNRMIKKLIIFLFSKFDSMKKRDYPRFWTENPDRPIRIQYPLLNKILVRMIPLWFSQMDKADKKGITHVFGQEPSITCTFYAPQELFKQLALNRLFEYESLLGMKNHIIDPSRHKDMCEAMELILQSPLDSISDFFLFLTLPYDHDSPLRSLLWKYYKFQCYYFEKIFGESSVNVFLYSPILYVSMVRYESEKKKSFEDLHRKDFIALLHKSIPVNNLNDIQYKKQVKKIMREGRVQFFVQFIGIMEYKRTVELELPNLEPHLTYVEIRYIMHRIAANNVADPYLISETVMTILDNLVYSKRDPLKRTRERTSGGSK